MAHCGWRPMPYPNNVNFQRTIGKTHQQRLVAIPGTSDITARKHEYPFDHGGNFRWSKNSSEDVRSSILCIIFYITLFNLLYIRIIMTITVIQLKILKHNHMMLQWID